MKSPLDRLLPPAPKARKRKGSRKAAELQAEPLEKRAMMAVEIFSRAPSGAIVGGWATIISDGGDSIYAQQAATAPQSLLVANNSSFLGYKAIEDINSVRDVVVTNGTLVKLEDVEADSYPVLPFPITPGLPSDRTFFVLPDPSDDIDNDSDPITGEIRNGLGGQWKFRARPGLNGFWDFADSSSLNYVQLVPINAIGPTSLEARFSSRGNYDPNFNLVSNGVLEVKWDRPASLDAEKPPSLNITYDREFSAGLFNPNGGTDIVASSSKDKATPLL